AGATWIGTESEHTGVSQGYHDPLAYFADLTDRGLLVPESLTPDDDAAHAKLVSAESASTGSDSQEGQNYRSAFADAGNFQADMRRIVVPAGPAGNRMDAGTGGRFESGIAFSASAAEQDSFVAMLQFVDWLYYSDEGLEFAKWGVEGETFTTDDEGNRTLV